MAIMNVDGVECIVSRLRGSTAVLCPRVLDDGALASLVERLLGEEGGDTRLVVRELDDYRGVERVLRYNPRTRSISIEYREDVTLETEYCRRLESLDGTRIEACLYLLPRGDDDDDDTIEAVVEAEAEARLESLEAERVKKRVLDLLMRTKTVVDEVRKTPIIRDDHRGDP